MPIDKCPIQDTCTQYNSGDNKPPNHHVRETILCSKTKHCEAFAWNMKWLASGPSCNISKVKRLKCQGQ